MAEIQGETYWHFTQKQNFSKLLLSQSVLIETKLSNLLPVFFRFWNVNPSGIVTSLPERRPFYRPRGERSFQLLRDAIFQLKQTSHSSDATAAGRCTTCPLYAEIRERSARFVFSQTFSFVFFLVVFNYFTLLSSVKGWWQILRCLWRGAPVTLKNKCCTGTVFKRKTTPFSSFYNGTPQGDRYASKKG